MGERGHWGPDLKLTVKGTLFQKKSLIRIQMLPPLLLMTRDDSRKKPAPRKQASAHPLRFRSRWERGQAEGRHLEETPLELTDFLMGMLKAGKELRFNLPRKQSVGGGVEEWLWACV